MRDMVVNVYSSEHSILQPPTIITNDFKSIIRIRLFAYWLILHTSVLQSSVKLRRENKQNYINILNNNIEFQLF